MMDDLERINRDLKRDIQILEQINEDYQIAVMFIRDNGLLENYRLLCRQLGVRSDEVKKD